MKLLKECPLLLLLVVSGIVISLIGLLNLGGVYADFERTTVMTPALAAVFQGAKDGRFPWSDPEPVLTIAREERTEEDAFAQGEQPPEDKGEEAPEAAAPSEDAEDDGEKTWDFTRVEEDYFDDAVFIGDSRTQGMLEYGGLEDRAKFYCQTSLTVYDLFKKDRAFIKEDGETLTLTQALTKHRFGKIYLMIGINEMGTGTPESFFEEYARAVFQIRKLQPGAVIFLQSIMRVAEEKNATDPLFNNTNINIRNVEIQTLADNRNYFYLDVNEAVCDENGNLHADWTFDQIHLKAKYYQVWKEYLLDHGIVKD